ncbi:MAG: AzlD domain-containing protein [Lachnospiraceae bacterium]|nr:AzlD domain-containing protein [Lachnospiraceae bacterium]
MNHNIIVYLIVMAAVTYLIRVLPLTIFRKEIKNRTIRSFLHYVPYVTLSVMTVPAIFSAATNLISGIAAFVMAVLLAYFEKSLFQVAAGACFVVFVLELIL